jgi:hypothetical protein
MCAVSTHSKQKASKIVMRKLDNCLEIFVQFNYSRLLVHTVHAIMPNFKLVCTSVLYLSSGYASFCFSLFFVISHNMKIHNQGQKIERHINRLHSL